MTSGARRGEPEGRARQRGATLRQATLDELHNSGKAAGQKIVEHTLWVLSARDRINKFASRLKGALGPHDREVGGDGNHAAGEHMTRVSGASTDADRKAKATAFLKPLRERASVRGGEEPLVVAPAAQRQETFHDWLASGPGRAPGTASQAEVRQPTRRGSSPIPDRRWTRKPGAGHHRPGGQVLLHRETSCQPENAVRADSRVRMASAALILLLPATLTGGRSSAQSIGSSMTGGRVPRALAGAASARAAPSVFWREMAQGSLKLLV
jgi:hypothetical protein